MFRVKIGALDVSALGLGCMGMSEYYGPSDWDSSVATIRRAIELGVTFFDTADQYGAGHNEVLVGRGLAGSRDKVQIATKFGIDRSSGDARRTVRGDAAYVKRSAEASLLRLGVEVIDLYYVHRPPQNVELEETIGAMGELVDAGKVRYLGVSEFDAEQLRRAHAVHPITALESEYSLWTREVEAVMPTLHELGIGLVAYSPLGRGFLTATMNDTVFPADDVRSRNPRFRRDARTTNGAITDRLLHVAQRLDVTPAQVAIAWVHAKADRLGVPIVPIPGTRHIDRLEQNVAAMDLYLDEELLAELEDLHRMVAGDRYTPNRA